MSIAINPDNPFVLAMKNWDAIVPTSECRHCEGTGIAPGDGTTDCGFCEADKPSAPCVVLSAGASELAWQERNGIIYGLDGKPRPKENP